MEGLGKKLREARLARGLTLDEAGRLTKIRPGRLEEIENEDFSQFASLAYAKGFLLIYGKFLDVDVSPYLEAFETSESVTVDGYSYLQDAPDPEPIRPVKVRRRSSSSSFGDSGPRSSIMPLIIGVLVLVIGFTLMKWVLQMQRLKPAPTPGTSPLASATVPGRIVAPQAQPLETPAPTLATAPTPLATTPPAASPTEAAVPTITPSVPAPAPAEPEVRRAEPVHPEDAAVVPTPTPSPKRSPRRTSPSPSAKPSGSVRPSTSATVRPR